METLTLHFNKNIREKLMQFLSGFPEKDLKIDEFTEKQKPRKSGIEIALEDEKKGRVTSYKNSDDLFEKVLN